MAMVLTRGGFDDIRARDIRFLEEAAKWGPLAIGLLPDESLSKVKFSAAERAYILRAIRFVSDVAEGEPVDVIPGTILAVRECEASTEGEARARDQGFDYRVIAESALDGFARPLENASPAGPKVAVSGCYDWLHSGHVRFFEEAASYGVLHVFLGNDANIEALKGPGHPLYRAVERAYVAASVRHVFRAVISEGMGMLDFRKELALLKPDIFVVNEDGARPAKEELCRELGIAYRILKRVPAEGLPVRSSTALRGF